MYIYVHIHIYVCIHMYMTIMRKNSVDVVSMEYTTQWWRIHWFWHYTSQPPFCASGTRAGGQGAPDGLHPHYLNEPLRPQPGLRARGPVVEHLLCCL